MKVRFNRWYNAVLTALLSMLGYGCSSENSVEMYGSPVLMYGVPSANYQISGTVTDASGKAVQGIKTSIKNVTIYDGQTHTYGIDSVTTDVAGRYDLKLQSFPENKENKLIVEDVDGETNGAYQNDTIDINYTNAQKIKEGDSGWNNGTFVIKQDIKLKKK